MFLTKKFPPTQRKNLIVAERLLDMLRLRDIGKGRKLPSERELATIFGVSRTVIREALNSLQMAGLIERWAGDGTYVTIDLENADFDLLALNGQLDASVILMETNQARESIDLAVTKLALENARLTDIKTMQALISEMQAVLDRGEFRYYCELTLRLHIAIGRASGNSVLERIVTELVAVVRSHMGIIVRHYTAKIAEQSFRIHKDMAEGIRLKDADLALNAVRQHYDKYPSLQR